MRCTWLILFWQLLYWQSCFGFTQCTINRDNIKIKRYITNGLRKMKSAWLIFRSVKQPKVWALLGWINSILNEKHSDRTKNNIILNNLQCPNKFTSTYLIVHRVSIYTLARFKMVPERLKHSKVDLSRWSQIKSEIKG